MEANNNTALLVMDMLKMLLGSMTDTTALLHNVAGAIAKARERGIPVIYIVVGFRQGMPEVSMSNKTFAARKPQMAQMDMNQWMAIHEAVAPQEGDIVVVKRRVSAFTGSDLEVVLRAQGIQHLVLTGATTSGVVLSTVREAADKDYRLTVLADCCADRDPEVHRILTEKVLPAQADVMNVGDF